MNALSPIMMPSYPAINKVVKQFAVVWSSGQERGMNNHATTGDAQTKFETIVVQLFGSKEPVISFRLETAVTSSASIGANRQWNGIDNLAFILSLTAYLGQMLLHPHLDACQISRLSHIGGSLLQGRKEVTIVRVEIVKEVFIAKIAEIFAANINGYDLFVNQGRRKAALTQLVEDKEGDTFRLLNRRP